MTQQFKNRFSLFGVVVPIGLGLAIVAITASAQETTPPKKDPGSSKTIPIKPLPVATDKRKIDPKKIIWLNFSDGLKYARAERKHVLLDFTASWCGWCKRMDAETFSDTTVINYINANFIPVKVWGDSEEKLDLDGQLVPQSAIARDLFRIQSYPTFHFLRPSDQKLVRGMPGYQQREDFLRVLEYVKDEKYDTTKHRPGAPPTDGKG